MLGILKMTFLKGVKKHVRNVHRGAKEEGNFPQEFAHVSMLRDSLPAALACIRFLSVSKCSGMQLISYMCMCVQGAVVLGWCTLTPGSSFGEGRRVGGLRKP